MTSVVLSTCLETTLEKNFESETYNSSYTRIYASGSKVKRLAKMRENEYFHRWKHC